MNEQQMMSVSSEEKDDHYKINREYKKSSGNECAVYIQLTYLFIGMRTTIDQLYPDIWQEVFEYFNAIELFNSLVHVTNAADEVLFIRNHHFRLRGLVVDVYLQTLPEKLRLSQIVSLELHEKSCLDIIYHCLQVRSLKLIGQPEWIICLLTKLSYTSMQLERLTLVVSGIGSLHDLLASTVPLLALHRLEIDANELEERIKTGILFPIQTKIEQFILQTCSSINWGDLSYMLSSLSNIRFLDITLSHYSKSSFSTFIFPKLRYVHLKLVEVSFEWIIQLVTTTPSLVKLKLSGLVDGEGFVVNHKWLSLFKLCSSLNAVIVSVSLEEGTDSFRSHMIQTALREINLHLRCIDDDQDYYLIGGDQQRWWNLSGMIIRQSV